MIEMKYDIKIKFSHLWRLIKNRIPFVNVPVSKWYIGKSDISIEKFELLLIGKAFQYNYFSYTEKEQVSNMRKLYTEFINGDEEIRQIHVRLFKDGSIYAHDELAYEYDALGHVNTESLKRINSTIEHDLIRLLSIMV